MGQSNQIVKLINRSIRDGPTQGHKIHPMPKSNKYAMTRNWGNQNLNPAHKT